MSTSQPYFDPSCLSGGTWYACGNGTKFAGCCTTNPCNNNGCFQGDLRPVAFDISQYGNFSDQLCSGGSFYTCVSTSPSFMGCCASNPCQENGCPTVDLRAAYLSNNIAEANQYDPDPPLQNTQSSVSTSTSAPATATSTAVLSPASNVVSDHHSSSIGAIAGGAAGGAVVLLVLIVCFVLWRRRQQAKQQQGYPLTIYHQVADKTMPPVSGVEYSPYLDDKQKQPPSYSTELPSPIASSPMPLIHEAASREVTYLPSSHNTRDSPQDSSRYGSEYSPQPSPVWGTDRANGGHNITVGLGFRTVDGSIEHPIAELDAGEISGNVGRQP